MATPDDTPELQALLEQLRTTRGFDFSSYKRTTLSRRLQHRMAALSLDDYARYGSYLEAHPEEYDRLLNAFLINVTSFFRDPAAWDYVDRMILRPLAARATEEEPARIWCAGCASGEEAYTLAILLAESLGLPEAKARVKLYATDIDDDALITARRGRYPLKAVAELSTNLRERYFEVKGETVRVDKELRRMVIFGRHDLASHPPISKVDLLTCRNTLMYFRRDSQARILTAFHFALKDGGHLFVGKAEMPLSHNIFTVVDLKYRIFAKDGQRAGLRRPAAPLPRRSQGVSPMSNQSPLHELALDAHPIASMLVDTAGLVRLINAPARAMFNLDERDLGRPLRDLEVSYRPVELRSLIDRVLVDRRSRIVPDVEWSTPGGVRHLEVHVLLLGTADAPSGTGLLFVDTSRTRHLQEELRRSRQELETAYEELQSTNEELETTNEELQSTVEELETTNEELQSTNEELETMNEELHSTNEELESANAGMRDRSREILQLNTYLQSILKSVRSGIVVVDREMLVQIWNDAMQELWGLRPDEAVGAHFLNLDVGIPLEDLRSAIKACLAGNQATAPLELPAVNRRGRSIITKVTCMPLRSSQEEVDGAIIVMDEVVASQA